MPPLFFTSKKRTMLMMKDKRITPLPITLIAVFDNDLLKSPFIKNPSKGKTGTRKIRLPIPLMLILQSVQKINIYRMYIPVHHYNYCQTNTYFCSSYYHNKENK